MATSVILASLADIGGFVFGVVTTSVLAIGAMYGYLKFRRYESEVLAARNMPSLNVSLETSVYEGDSPETRILAFRASVSNPGHVKGRLHPLESYFHVLRLTPHSEGFEEEEVCFVPMVSLERYGDTPVTPDVVRPNATLSYTGACTVAPGIYRISAEFPLLPDDIADYARLIGVADRLDELENIVWSSEVVVDARALHAPAPGPAT